MSETPLEFSGSGTENDPITFDAHRPTTTDPVDAAVAGMGTAVFTYAAGFREAADLSWNLPDDVRELVNQASSAITSTVNTARTARSKADDFRADVTMYPAGRDYLVNETIKAAAAKVKESLEQADDQITVASAMTYEAARPAVPADAAMPARVDLQMLTQRHVQDPGALAGKLRGLAQRSDAVGALVADEGYMRDFLDAQGVEPDVQDAILTTVRTEVVKAAASSGDPKRSAAARTHLALTELRKARIAATSFAGHLLGR